jgi:putative transcriptional regulator
LPIARSEERGYVVAVPEELNSLASNGAGDVLDVFLQVKRHFELSLGRVEVGKIPQLGENRRGRMILGRRGEWRVEQPKADDAGDRNAGNERYSTEKLLEHLGCLLLAVRTSNQSWETERQNGAVNSMYGTTRGMLLLATPPLDDPNFDRSVVYMMEHSAEGAVGVVLNNPTAETAIDGLGLWMDLVAPPAVVFNGGPVQFDALIAIAEVQGPREDAWSGILPDLGSVDLARDPIDVADEIGRVRMFRGYAGWAPGQLDSELDGARMVFDALRGDVFHSGPTTSWRLVLRRQRGRVACVGQRSRQPVDELIQATPVKASDQHPAAVRSGLGEDRLR